MEEKINSKQNKNFKVKDNCLYIINEVLMLSYIQINISKDQTNQYRLWVCIEISEKTLKTQMNIGKDD